MEKLENEVTENLAGDVIETVEVDSVNSGNGLVKVAIGVGIIVTAGVATLIYKKIKNNGDKNNEDAGKKRFSILKKHKNQIEEDVIDDFDNFDDEE